MSDAHPPASTPLPPTWRSSWRLLGSSIRRLTPAALLRTLLALSVLSFAVLLIWSSLSAIWPFMIGGILIYLGMPLINYLETFMPRWLAILLLYLIGFALLFGAVGLVIPVLINQIIQLINAFPSIQDIERYADFWLASYESYVSLLPDLVRRSIDQGIAEVISTLRNNFLIYAQNVVEFLLRSVIGLFDTFTLVLGLLMLPFWMFYVLNDGSLVKRTCDILIPSWMQDDFWAVLTIADRVFSSYIRGQVVLAIIITIASYLGLTLLQMLGVSGIQYKLLLSIFAGVMEFIPYIGPIIGAIPAIAVGLLHSWETGIAVTLLYLTIQQLEGNLLIPRIVGYSVGIHPAGLMILLVIFSQFGILWMFLAAPTVAITRDIVWYTHGRLKNPPQPAGFRPGPSAIEQHE